MQPRSAVAGAEAFSADVHASAWKVLLRRKDAFCADVHPPAQRLLASSEHQAGEVSSLETHLCFFRQWALGHVLRSFC